MKKTLIIFSILLIFLVGCNSAQLTINENIEFKCDYIFQIRSNHQIIRSMPQEVKWLLEDLESNILNCFMIHEIKHGTIDCNISNFKKNCEQGQKIHSSMISSMKLINQTLEHFYTNCNAQTCYSLKAMVNDNINICDELLDEYDQFSEYEYKKCTSIGGTCRRRITWSRRLYSKAR